MSEIGPATTLGVAVALTATACAPLESSTETVVAFAAQPAKECGQLESVRVWDAGNRTAEQNLGKVVTNLGDCALVLDRISYLPISKVPHLGGIVIRCYPADHIPPVLSVEQPSVQGEGGYVEVDESFIADTPALSDLPACEEKDEGMQPAVIAR